MIKSFSDYVSAEPGKEIVFAFGRFNPPSSNHEAFLDSIATVAGPRNYRIYLSKATEAKANPLQFADKVKFLRKMFPKHARSVMSDDDVLNPIDICAKLYSQGVKKVTMVAGSDRVIEYKQLLNKYNGQPASNGKFYNFRNGIEVISTGTSDPDVDVASASARAKAAASANDFESFAKSVPATFAEKTELFNAIRSGMGLKESRNFRKHIQLESVSKRREDYVSGDLFAIGDEVVILENNQVGKISVCGSNYVIVETSAGNKYRKWLTDVEKLIEPETEDVLVSESMTELPNQTIAISHSPEKTGIPISAIRNRL